MARNLEALVPLVRELGPAQIAFCTDDRDPDDIVDDGHINGMVRKAVELGRRARRTRSSARRSTRRTGTGCAHLGAVAPGYQADLLVLPDLESFRPELVLKAGRRSARSCGPDVPEWVRQSVRVAPLSRADFAAPSDGGCDPRDRARAGPGRDGVARRPADGRGRLRGRRPRARPGEDRGRRAAPRDGPRRPRVRRAARGCAAARSPRRWRTTRTTSSCSASPTTTCWRPSQRVVELGGGIVAVDGGRIVAECPLPVAGLFSVAPLDEVIAQSRACTEAAVALGWSGATPFLTMSFLALSVIPALKITDRGLVDVERFELVPLEVSSEPAASRRARRDDGRRGLGARGRLGARRGRAGRGGRRRRAARGGRARRPRRRRRHARPRQHAPPPVPDAHAGPGAGGRPLHVARRRSIRSGPASTRSRCTRPRAPGSPSSRSPAARRCSTTTTSFRAGRAG